MRINYAVLLRLGSCIECFVFSAIATGVEGCNPRRTWDNIVTASTVFFNELGSPLAVYNLGRVAYTSHLDVAAHGIVHRAALVCKVFDIDIKYWFHHDARCGNLICNGLAHRPGATSNGRREFSRGISQSIGKVHFYCGSFRQLLRNHHKGLIALGDELFGCATNVSIQLQSVVSLAFVACPFVCAKCMCCLAINIFNSDSSYLTGQHLVASSKAYGSERMVEMQRRSVSCLTSHCLCGSGKQVFLLFYLSRYSVCEGWCASLALVCQGQPIGIVWSISEETYVLLSSWPEVVGSPI